MTAVTVECDEKSVADKAATGRTLSCRAKRGRTMSAVPQAPSRKARDLATRLHDFGDLLTPFVPLQVIGSLVSFPARISAGKIAPNQHPSKNEPRAFHGVSESK